MRTSGGNAVVIATMAADKYVLGVLTSADATVYSRSLMLGGETSWTGNSAIMGTDRDWYGVVLTGGGGVRGAGVSSSTSASTGASGSAAHASDSPSSSSMGGCGGCGLPACSLAGFHGCSSPRFGLWCRTTCLALRRFGLGLGLGLGLEPEHGHGRRQ